MTADRWAATWMPVMQQVGVAEHWEADYFKV